MSELTDKMKKELDVLKNMADEDIDLTDIPEITEEKFKNAVRGRLYRPNKLQITARLDADILEWLKSGGPGYQSRMNKILREVMIADLSRNNSSASDKNSDPM